MRAVFRAGLFFLCDSWTARAWLRNGFVPSSLSKDISRFLKTEHWSDGGVELADILGEPKNSVSRVVNRIELCYLETWASIKWKPASTASVLQEPVKSSSTVRSFTVPDWGNWLGLPPKASGLAL